MVKFWQFHLKLLPILLHVSQSQNEIKIILISYIQSCCNYWANVYIYLALRHYFPLQTFKGKKSPFLSSLIYQLSFRCMASGGQTLFFSVFSFLKVTLTDRAGLKKVITPYPETNRSVSHYIRLQRTNAQLLIIHTLLCDLIFLDKSDKDSEWKCNYISCNSLLPFSVFPRTKVFGFF